MKYNLQSSNIHDCVESKLNLEAWWRPNLKQEEKKL